MKIKEYEDSLQAAKISWEDGEERLKSIVARAQSRFGTFFSTFYASHETSIIANSAYGA